MYLFCTAWTIQGPYSCIYIQVTIYITWYLDQFEAYDILQIKKPTTVAYITGRQSRHGDYQRKSSYSSATDQDNCQLFRTRRPATDEYWRVIKLAANIQVPSCGRTRIRPVLAQHCVATCGVSFSTGPALGQRWPVVVFLVIIVYIITLHVSCASRIGRLMS